MARCWQLAGNSDMKKRVGNQVAWTNRKLKLNFEVVNQTVYCQQQTSNSDMEMGSVILSTNGCLGSSTAIGFLLQGVR